MIAAPPSTMCAAAGKQPLVKKKNKSKSKSIRTLGRRGRAAAPCRTPVRSSVAVGAVSELASAALLGNPDIPVATQLGIYAAKTLVDWLVPLGGVGVIALGTAATLAGKKRKEAILAKAAELDEEDLGGTGGKGGSPLSALMAGGKKGPKGAPVEYLKVEKLNTRLESYSYSLQKASAGGGVALKSARRQALARRLGESIAASLDSEQLAAIAAADEEWARSGVSASAELDRVSKAIRAEAVTKAKAKPSSTKAADESKDASASEKGFKLPSMGKNPLQKEMEAAIKARVNAEARYLSQVASVLTSDQRERLTALMASDSAPGFGSTSLLPKINNTNDGDAKGKKQVFVLTFKGDIQASQVNALREEVTAVIRSADASRGDECVVILSSGGGTVTGYGLAAAQLSRLKAAGIKLTVNVEQVAASGGYMMACVGDTINASPFAVLGSIGVISEQPNVYERLKNEGIEFTTVTAGKFKRTLTPTKKVTKEDFEKSKQDVAEILKLFRDFVNTNRPTLDIDKVATGETWFGDAALAMGLCDALKTADDYLLELFDQGADIFSIRYSPPMKGPALPGLAAGSGVTNSLQAALGSWLLGGLALPVSSNASTSPYYMIDRAAGSEQVASEGAGSMVNDNDDWPHF